MKALDQEEKEILEAYESGKMRRVPDVKKEIARHKRAAAATFAKDARINIRISSSAAAASSRTFTSAREILKAKDS